jgi:hypothetical protein
VLRPVIFIYSIEHLARALWADEEEHQREVSKVMHSRNTYRPVAWEDAHELDRKEYRERAERVVRLCRAQAKERIA